MCHDEDKVLCVIPCWSLKGWKIRIEWNYQSDEDGNILKRRFNLKWIHRDGHYHLWGYRMLIFSLRGTYRDWNSARKNEKDHWSINHLKDSAKERGCRNPEWWRKVNAFFAKLALKNLKVPLDAEPQY